MNKLPYGEQHRLGQWLSNLPYYWDVHAGPTQWYAVHGMWVPGMDKYSPHPQHAQASVYGRGLNGKRCKFWDDTEYIEALPSNTYTVSGHYHKVITKPPCYVVDSNCGSGGPLMGLCFNNLQEYKWGGAY